MSQTSITSLLATAGVALGVAGTAAAEVSQSPDEVRAIVAEMMADANTRSSLLQSNASAGHDGGNFFLADPEGNYRLNVSGFFQFRYFANFSDEGNPTDNDDFTGGFENTRTRLKFDGHIVNKDLFYEIEGDFGSGAGGDFNLLDAYVGYRFGDGFELKWGQFKAPFLREELVSPQYQLTVEKSLTNEVFTGNRTQGIELSYHQEDWRAFFAFTDGFNAANTRFTNDQQNFTFTSRNGDTIFTPTGGGGEADWAITARAELKLAGAWDQFTDFTSMPDSDYGAMVGVAAHFEQNQTLQGADTNPADGIPDGTADVNIGAYTVDLSLEGNGWNFFAALIASTTDFDQLANTDGNALNGNDNASFTDYGIVAQAGMFIPNTDWEVFARYDGIIPDDERLQDDTFNTVTVGTNWYWAGHAAKFTLDAVILLDEAIDDGADPNNNSGNPLAQSGLSNKLGIVGTQDDTEVAFRAQFQLLF